MAATTKKKKGRGCRDGRVHVRSYTRKCRGRKSGADARRSSRKRACKHGVNKRTKKCLKHPRQKKR